MQNSVIRMKTDVPIISIVTPSFNQAAFITTTIESVLEQQAEGIEHIVVDGGSSDETVSILKRYRHLTWLSEPDKGQSDADNRLFNAASVHARGEGEHTNPQTGEPEKGIIDVTGRDGPQTLDNKGHGVGLFRDFGYETKLFELTFPFGCLGHGCSQGSVR